MRDEGVTKYEVEWLEGDAPESRLVAGLIACRDRLFSTGFIGVYPDGIGFGNVSEKPPGSSGFFITGSQTGALPNLQPKHISRVVDYDIAGNRVVCAGAIQASSESLTHAAVYELDAAIGAVVHVHHRGLWLGAQNELPTTDPSLPYGTPAMAREMQRLFVSTNLKVVRVLVMAGHEEGCISFGTNLAEAELALQNVVSRFHL